MATPKILYTFTDEAPYLATQSLLPVIRAFSRSAGVAVETRDISLAARILAAFPEHLQAEQQQSDDLAELGELAKTPEANIIKLPNISASVPQLKAAIAELQGQGFALPDYPEEEQSEADKETRQRYARVLGSAVNPVLREGNSDRRVARAVKAYAQAHPHRMGAWSSESRSRVAHMEDGDYYGSELSHVMQREGSVRIEFTSASGERVLLREGLPLLQGEVIDSSRMSLRKLRAFYGKSIERARREGLLLSLHLKATMMKVSDPVFFGCAVREYYAPFIEKHSAKLDSMGFNPNMGVGDLEKKLEGLRAAEKQSLEQDLRSVYEQRPPLAMVDSDRGITNLHVPSDIIIDASMPAMIRSSGQMWGPDGQLADTLALIPDRCYAGIYQECMAFCREHGAFDPATMGNVSNVGLMAQKAEEYGSHDKTFQAPGDGVIRVLDAGGDVLLEHRVEQGDVWRMCQTKDVAIRDWVRLAVKRARRTGSPAIFWLDNRRAHDANLITLVERYLKDHDTQGLDLRILPPVEAIRLSMERARKGEDTVSVTGNVLRDYLTDLFPILELGTSAKMLSIVPLLAGGGLYETGAGGSAPKHVQQFVQEGHLRWDSLGEFLALAVSLEDLATRSSQPAAGVLAKALDTAIGRVLEEGKSPLRKVHQLDNRGSHFYLSLFWARAMAEQDEDKKLAATFAPLAEKLAAAEEKILQELDAAQGEPLEIGGYYRPDLSALEKAMRPSATWNAIIDGMS